MAQAEPPTRPMRTTHRAALHYAAVIGRRRVLLILALLYTVSAIVSALAPNYLVLVIARFTGGLAFASLGVAPMYIGEIAPREKRGMLVTVNQLNIVVGFSVAYFANYFVLLASQSDAASKRGMRPPMSMARTASI